MTALAVLRDTAAAFDLHFDAILNCSAASAMAFRRVVA
jgi:hypothetical protein